MISLVSESALCKKQTGNLREPSRTKRHSNERTGHRVLSRNRTTDHNDKTNDMIAYHQKCSYNGVIIDLYR